MTEEDAGHEVREALVHQNIRREGMRGRLERRQADKEREATKAAVEASKWLRENPNAPPLERLKATARALAFWKLYPTLEELLGEIEQEIQQLRDGYQATGLEGTPCPGCVYEDGVFVSRCRLHNQIKNLKLTSGAVSKHST